MVVNFRHEPQSLSMATSSRAPTSSYDPFSADFSRELADAISMGSSFDGRSSRIFSSLHPERNAQRLTSFVGTGCSLLTDAASLLRGSTPTGGSGQVGSSFLLDSSACHTEGAADPAKWKNGAEEQHRELLSLLAEGHQHAEFNGSLQFWAKFRADLRHRLEDYSQVLQTQKDLSVPSREAEAFNNPYNWVRQRSYLIEGFSTAREMQGKPSFEMWQLSLVSVIADRWPNDIWGTSKLLSHFVPLILCLAHCRASGYIGTVALFEEAAGKGIHVANLEGVGRLCDSVALHLCAINLYACAFGR